MFGEQCGKDSGEVPMYCPHWAIGNARTVDGIPWVCLAVGCWPL